MRIRRRACAIGTVVVSLASVGLAGAGVAHASGVTIGVAPSTGLTDGGTVTISVNGATPSAAGQLFIAECGNAYANGTPLPATVDVDQDCTTIGWIFSPFNPQNFTIKQTGIGSGNRSCVATANRSCYVYGPSGINMGTLPTPSVNISFAHDPTGSGAQPSPTTTTLTAVGSPIATGKAQHLRVHVLDDVYFPDGAVTITDGSSTVASGTATHGVADILLSSSYGLGTHTLVAHFPGDGSFAPSDSPPVDLTVVPVDNVSVGDASVVGGVGGSRTINFPVVLSTVPTTAVVVPYSVVPGTAHAGTEYVAPKPTAMLKFKAFGPTLKYVTVKLLSDTNPTGTKTFTVHLGTPSGGYALRDADGTGTLYDPANGGATVNVGALSMPEGDTGSPHGAKFPVTLSVVPTRTTVVTVTIATGLTDTATKDTRAKGGDYNSKYTFTVTFLGAVAPRVGAVTKYVSASVFPDTVADELDETFTVTLTNVVSDPAQPVSLGRSTATGVIISDE